jgi:hypothetical protein
MARNGRSLPFPRRAADEDDPRAQDPATRERQEHNLGLWGFWLGAVASVVAAVLVVFGLDLLGILVLPVSAVFLAAWWWGNRWTIGKMDTTPGARPSLPRRRVAVGIGVAALLGAFAAPLWMFNEDVVREQEAEGPIAWDKKYDALSAAEHEQKAALALPSPPADQDDPELTRRQNEYADVTARLPEARTKAVDERAGDNGKALTGIFGQGDVYDDRIIDLQALEKRNRELPGEIAAIKHQLAEDRSRVATDKRIAQTKLDDVLGQEREQGKRPERPPCRIAAYFTATRHEPMARLLPVGLGAFFGFLVVDLLALFVVVRRSCRLDSQYGDLGEKVNLQHEEDDRAVERRQAKLQSAEGLAGQRACKPSELPAHMHPGVDPPSKRTRRDA